MYLTQAAYTTKMFIVLVTLIPLFIDIFEAKLLVATFLIHRYNTCII